MDPTTRDGLAALTPDQINTLREQGHLDHLLRPGTPEAPAPEATEAGTEAATSGYTVADLAGMSAEQIVDRLRAGDLDGLLRGQHPEPAPEPPPRPDWKIDRLDRDELTR